jgi:4-amino-4-deoxy-L-arabinose transferase-like glycosyltransferase
VRRARHVTSAETWEYRLNRRSVALLLILLLALGLRLWGLADHNIWWDEGLTAWAARLSPQAIIEWTAHDVHPPLYFLLVRQWWLLMGDGEWALRFPSALIGVLGVALAAGFGRALGGSRASLLAALFVTLSRFAVTWSQEMRMYIWAATLATAALWAAYELWRRGGWRPWLAYVLTVGLGFWTLYLNVSIPIIANLAFPVFWLRADRSRRLLVSWIAAQLAALGLFIPWLIYALPRMISWSTAEPFSPSFFLRLYTTMLAVGVPVNLEIYVPLTLAVLGLFAACLLVLWRAPRSPEQTAAWVMLLLGMVLPALVVYAVSFPGHRFYAPRLAPRYLLPLAICFYLLLAWGTALMARRLRFLAAASATVVAVVALVGLGTLYPGRARTDDYLSVSAALAAYRQPGDNILLHPDQDWPLFAAHYAGSWQGIPAGLPVETSGARELLADLWARSDGLWLITTPNAQQIDPKQEIQGWLANHALGSARWPFGEVALTLYARTPERAKTLQDLTASFVVPQMPGNLSDGTELLGAWVPLRRYLTGDTVHLALFWDEIPQGRVQITVAGPVRREAAILPPLPASHGPTRQQVDLPLTPDLPAGDYQLLVQAGEGPERLAAQFELLPRQVPGASPDAAITHRLQLRLGESITLLGYDLPRATAHPGETIDLVLYWRADGPVALRYKVFTHLVGQTYNPASGNMLWGQQDNEPLNDQAPTTIWPPGAVIADPYRIAVDSGAPAGRYDLEAGMYRLLDGARLPVTDQAGQLLGDTVTLEQIQVTAQTTAR